MIGLRPGFLTRKRLLRGESTVRFWNRPTPLPGRFRWDDKKKKWVKNRAS